MISVADLQTITQLHDLDDDVLQWLSENLEEVHLEADEVFLEAGSPAEWMFILFKGRIRVVVKRDLQPSSTFVLETGDINGMLPRSRMTHFRGEWRATQPTRLGRLHAQLFPEMQRRFPALDARLAHLMLDRTRMIARVQLQQEKLASLGTMAAGLAHELNNPASAARRAAQNLCDTLQAFDEHASSMLRKMMFKHPSTDGDPFQPIYAITAQPPPNLDPLAQSEREDELADWLEEEGAENPWDAAATLVAMGFTQPVLATFSEGLVDEYVVDFLNWLARDMEMRLLAEELAESTVRISDLVSAMKSYSFMDQAQEKQHIDLHQGIDSTLTILKHKLKNKQVDIVKHYGDLPSVPAYGGELNQVWTNLLDNAIAALPGTNGRIVIKTACDLPASQVHVDIIDNGSGIPPDVQNRIFEPFFTTKGAGEGTGLGLDIVYRIVTARHGGTIQVTSTPGNTRFHLQLPLES